MEKKQKYFLILIIGVCLGTIGIILLYLINQESIAATISTIEGAFLVLIVLIVRVSILAVIAIYLFIRWFLQEKIYTSDLPFLFGIFFLILIYGKLLDLLTNFLYPIVTPDIYLFYLKIRQLLLIGTLAPMIFLSIMMIITILQLNGKIKKYNNPNEINRISLKILVIIAVVEALIIILTPNTTFAGINIAIFVVSSLIVITWIFYFIYRNKRLSQVHPLIIAIGFTAYLLSNIFRPIAQNIIGENAIFIVITEIIDIIIGIVIFIGYIKKANY